MPQECKKNDLTSKGDRERDGTGMHGRVGWGVLAKEEEIPEEGTVE